MNENLNNNKKSRIIAVFAICVLLVVAWILIVSFEKDKLQGKEEVEKETEKIELNYTETSNNAVEGVYIVDVSEVVEKAMPSIVAITSKTLVTNGYYYGQQQYQEGAGSGIIIAQTDDDLMILTNNHVVAGAKELTVQFVNEKSYDAKIVATAEKKDVAVISVKIKDIDKETLKEIKIATIGDSNELKVGNGIIAIGNALGYGQSVTTGVVSALNRTINVDGVSYKMIQIDAAINGGNSGGALLNSQGEVVGINSAKYSSNAYSSSASIEGMGFAIPISDIKDLITDLMNGESIQGATIGIYGQIITEEESTQTNRPAGFYIFEIVEGSGADKSDLKIGDIITSIDGVDIKVMSDLENFLADKKKGDKVTLTVKYISGRTYKERTVKVELS